MNTPSEKNQGVKPDSRSEIQPDSLPDAKAHYAKAHSGANTQPSPEVGQSKSSPPQEDLLRFMNEVDAALHRKPALDARILSMGTVIVLGLFLLWAAWAEVDEVTRGQGQIIASQRTQKIENLEGGILQEMLVHEGQVVQKDAPLARISNETAESVYRDIQGKSNEHRAAIIRLKAEIAGKPPVFDADLHKIAPDVVEDQQRLYDTRISKRDAELETITLQCTQKNHEVEELKNRKKQLEKSLALAKQQLGITSNLVAKQLYSQVDYLNLQQKVTTLQGDVDSLSNTIPKAEAAALEAHQKKQLRMAEMGSQNAEEINKRRTELASLTESFAAGIDRVVRTELRSPVLGTVKQIFVTTVGGVVKPGEPIMEIVPLDDSLLVEARIRPSDVAFIHKGQKTMVKVSAYDFSIYGGIEGLVHDLSADTIEDKRGEFFYLAKIRTDTNAIVYHGNPLPIMPGMVCTVDILTGKRTILDFLLKPILNAQQNAFRER